MRIAEKGFRRWLNRFGRGDDDGNSQTRYVIAGSVTTVDAQGTRDVARQTAGGITSAKTFAVR